MIHAILIIGLIGFLVWLFTTLIPMAAPFKQVIVGLACFVAFVILLQALGLDTGFRIN